MGVVPGVIPSKEAWVDIFDKSKLRVKYKDIFDLKQFYDDLHEWLLEYGWGDPDEGGGEHWETCYGERLSKGGAREIWINWRVSKKAEGAPITYHMYFYFHCLGIMDTEVVKNGKKIKVNKGEVELNINGYLEKNYLKDLEKSPIIKPFIKLFNNRVYQSTIDQRKKELYQEMYVMQNWIKQWFKLKRHLPYEEVKGFFPSYAWPSHLKEQ